MMRMNRTARLALWLGFACVALGGPAVVARAGVVLATPAGLAPGDQFRIVFVTNASTNATSTDIATYNAFVNTDAAGATYDAAVVSWKVIGSTQTVDAATNIGAFAVPVYLSNGTLIALSTTTGAGGLWSGSILNPINTRLDGTAAVTPSNLVFTGTAADGTAASDYGALGGDTPGSLGQATVGLITFGTNRWIHEDFYSTTDTYALYGISEVLTVPAAVPEPGTVGLALLGAGAIGLRAWRRRGLRASA